MDTKPHNAVLELRKAKGYTLEQLSIVSGLTELEIDKLESGQVLDEAKLSRLLAAAGVAAGHKPGA